ncbi:MAG: enoyl-CoA hydratase/isomerase family protein [Pyrinomonadaceae bacterium]|nr:enoyl-CoA hydratase/isomerase family protein [Blastocatellia bacterium]MCW5957702.1 enoyl-CoA hydratase/isomerase family protein [Pyrinomonadaceae bacterium]
MSELLTESIGATRVLTLNRPEKRNALNDGLIASLKAALREADAEVSVRCIVIRGAGKDFCSGADLSALQKIASASYEENLEDARSLGELYKLIREVRPPVIAAVQGRALAGGCGLAMACDLIVAKRDAKFGFPEVKIGFVPAMVAAIVRRNMSERRAFATLTLGEEMSAEDLYQSAGIIHALADDDLEATLAAVTDRYARLSASAVQMTKRLLYEIDTLTFDSSIEHGAKVNATARMTEDCKKGIGRFLNK